MFFLSRLEDRGYLDPSSEINLFFLHYVFRPLLEIATADFVNMWDCHRLRAEWLSPNQLFTLGIEDRRRRSKKERKAFTELEQGISVSHRKIVHNLIYKKVKHNYERIRNPRIICPVTRKQHLNICELFPVHEINTSNVWETYKLLRAHVFDKCWCTTCVYTLLARYRVIWINGLCITTSGIMNLCNVVQFVLYDTFPFTGQDITT